MRSDEGYYSRAVCPSVCYITFSGLWILWQRFWDLSTLRQLIFLFTNCCNFFILMVQKRSSFFLHAHFEHAYSFSGHFAHAQLVYKFRSLWAIHNISCGCVQQDKQATNILFTNLTKLRKVSPFKVSQYTVNQSIRWRFERSLDYFIYLMLLHIP